MSPQQLVDDLIADPEPMWVRLTAHWMTREPELEPAPAQSGNVVIDALAAAAAADLARQRGIEPPAWTEQAERVLTTFWHPSRDG